MLRSVVTWRYQFVSLLRVLPLKYFSDAADPPRMTRLERYAIIKEKNNKAKKERKEQREIEKREWLKEAKIE